MSTYEHVLPGNNRTGTDDALGSSDSRDIGPDGQVPPGDDPDPSVHEDVVGNGTADRQETLAGNSPTPGDVAGGGSSRP
jgi:hypothetical protein